MKSIRVIFAVLVTSCASLATVNYQPYEGNVNFFGSDGGTKLSSGGIDFWTNGTPPQRFTILGIATGEIGSGYGDENSVRSAVAESVRQVGGSAAIQLENNLSFAGVVRTAPSASTAAGGRQVKFAIVKYTSEY
jgi:hypothetical protein